MHGENILEIYMNEIMRKLAEDILSVQPMSNDVMKDLFESAKDKAELEKDGYKPVSRLGLLWIKEKNNEQNDS